MRMFFFVFAMLCLLFAIYTFGKGERENGIVLVILMVVFGVLSFTV